MTTTLAYDADGNRVRVLYPDGGGDIYTPFPDVEKAIAGGVTTWRITFSAAGQMVAQRVTAGATVTLYSLHTDHLGSVVAMSWLGGTYRDGSLARYDPFGNYRTWPGSNANPTISDRGFTGHIHDNTGPYPTQNVGLIYMNARYYLPEVGRFVSADTIVPEPGNPQSYNRYSYALNSPLNYTDPTGHWPSWLEYAFGVAYQFANDLTFGLPDHISGTDWQEAQSYSFQNGQQLGRAAGTVVNVALTIDGIVKTGSGLGAMVPTALGGGLCGVATEGVCLVPTGVALTAEAGVVGVGVVEASIGGANLIIAHKNPVEGPRYTQNNFRENLKNRVAIPREMTKPQAHHVLPQALEGRFKKLFPDLNIHNPKWGAWVEGNIHQGWSGRYQAAWEQWLVQNPNATMSQLESQAAHLANQFGFTWP